MLKTEDLITPNQYLQLTAEEKSNISRIEIIPPRLGQNHFGMIKIIYKNPKYIIFF